MYYLLCVTLYCFVLFFVLKQHVKFNIESTSVSLKLSRFQGSMHVDFKRNICLSDRVKL